ncbi:hypothetical protein COJ85_29285, partial [Bacillus sp. AFS076308]
EDARVAVDRAGHASTSSASAPVAAVAEAAAASEAALARSARSCSVETWAANAAGTASTKLAMPSTTVKPWNPKTSTSAAPITGV